MSIDLFSEDWAEIPVENPLPAPKAESFILSAMGSPSSALGFPSSALGFPPVLIEMPRPTGLVHEPCADTVLFLPSADQPSPAYDDTHVLAFVAQAYCYGHRDQSLEPMHTNSAGRRFFDTEAVTRFAKSLVHREDDTDEGSDLRDDNEQMSQEIWRLAIEAARRTGRKGVR